MSNTPNNEWNENEWKNAETTISRDKLVDILCEETRIAVLAATLAGGEKLAKTVEELFLNFSSRIGARIFEDVDD